MCYESSWYQERAKNEELKKAKDDADRLIEQARTARKPTSPQQTEPAPVGEREKSEA